MVPLLVPLGSTWCLHTIFTTPARGSCMVPMGSIQYSQHLRLIPVWLDTIFPALAFGWCLTRRNIYSTGAWFLRGSNRFHTTFTVPVLACCLTGRNICSTEAWFLRGSNGFHTIFTVPALGACLFGHNLSSTGAWLLLDQAPYFQHRRLVPAWFQ